MDKDRVQTLTAVETLAFRAVIAALTIAIRESQRRRAFPAVFARDSLSRFRGARVTVRFAIFPDPPTVGNRTVTSLGRAAPVLRVLTPAVVARVFAYVRAARNGRETADENRRRRRHQ